jgi:hypothetical protein
MVAAQKPSMLLHLPNELLLLIFRFLPKISDVLNLSETCRQLHGLFTNTRHEFIILQSIAGVSTSANPDLSNAFSVLVQLAPSTWWLQGERDANYIIDIDYSDFGRQKLEKFTLRCLISFRNGSPSYDSLLKFLAQFHDMDERLQWFPRETCEIFSSAASLQEYILYQLPTTPDLYSDSMVIALALHCFAMLWPFQLLGDYSSIEDETEQHLIPEHDERPFLPSMGIRKDWSGWKPEPAPTVTGWEPGNLGSNLQCLMQRSREILLRERKEDWPIILYLLCILCLIIDSIGYLSRAMPRDWEIPLASALKMLRSQTSDLARLYYICSRGGQPLTARCCQDRYGGESNRHPSAIQHFCWLNDSWLEVEECDPECLRTIEHKGLDFFPEKVRLFMLGDPHGHKCWLCRD